MEGAVGVVMEHRHKKLERKSGFHHNHVNRKANKKEIGGGGGGERSPPGAAAASTATANNTGSKCDVSKYIGASLIKKEGPHHPPTNNDLTHLQKRALDLTGAPLINYNASHDSSDKREEAVTAAAVAAVAAAAAAAAKQAVYRTQSLNPVSQSKDQPDLQQLHQLLYLQQLQQQLHNQHPPYSHHFVTSSPMTSQANHDAYDSGHGSLEGSSCGSDHDLGGNGSNGSSCGSGHADAGEGGGGRVTGASKKLLEAANSMPVLPSYGMRPDNSHDLDRTTLGDDLEIELEDEQKYLPIDLFQDSDQHSKLCTSQSLRRRQVWEQDTTETAAASAAVAKVHGGGKAGIRKTSSLVAKSTAAAVTTATPTPSDGFTLFSDQLDLLSSIRSNWEKSSNSAFSSSPPIIGSCGSSTSSSSAADEDHLGLRKYSSDQDNLGLRKYSDQDHHSSGGVRKYSTSSLDSCSSSDVTNPVGTDDDITSMTSGMTSSKKKNLESAIKNLTYDMSTFLLRKI